LVNDIYGGFAQEFRAISPRRLSLQTTRYATGAVITPVGTNQAIDVTGRSKVVVTPAAAASISTATFTTTPADPVGDFGRNGELVIEAGNANLTIKHAASGANTFNITSGADLVLGAGDVVQFLRSEVGGNWRQIGGTSSGSSGAGQTYVTIFHNPFFDIYGAVDPTVGPPVGMTTPGSAVEETVTVYGGNPTAQSVRVTTSGTAIANGCTITPTIQPWGDPGSVSITIPVYATSNAARRVVVHGYNGVSYTLIGETSVISSWNLIKGTFTPIVGNNWSIVVSIWDGATYYSGWQFYVGGINIVKGVTPANTLEDSLGRRSYMVIAAAAPSRAPDFTGERWWDSAGSKFYVANGQTAVGNWIMLN
jgi:hypothetical protein